MSSRQVAAIVLLSAITAFPRLWQIGSLLSTDEPLWQGRSNVFVKALATGNFADTATSIQPGVTTTWIGALAQPLGTLGAMQASVAITSSVLILTITYFLVVLWGWNWGILAGAVLALDPFLIAHSRYIHTDALLALFSLLAMVSLIAAFSSPGQYPIRRYLVVSAAAAALAILTKIFALAFLPLFATYILYRGWRQKYSWLLIVQTGLFWLTTCLVSLFVAWPALWSSAGQTISYIYEGVNKYSTGTRIGEASSQWWYYLREGFFRLTPPVTIMAGVGLFLAWRSRADTFRHTIATLTLAGLFYAVTLSLRGERSDRYILFTLLTIDLVAVFGMKQLLRREIAFVMMGIFLLYLGLDDLRLHPYYHAHYNRLYPIEADHKMGWGEGLEQAAKYIEARHPGAKVSSYYKAVFSYFYRSGPVIGLAGDTNADYLILYRSMFERGPNDPDTDLSQQYIWSQRYQPEHIITLNDLPYVWIFKNE